MKYVLCLLMLAVAACSPATAPYPRDYTGGPPSTVYDFDDSPSCCGKHICPLGGEGSEKGKGCCDMPCCKNGCCKGAKPAATTVPSEHGHHGKPGDIYAGVMATMHEAMGAYTPTGDADTDFVLGMVPHHQGAVDMAEILLEQGDDPKLRQLARGIIVAQKREIAFMNYWLKTRGAMPDTNVTNVNIPK